MLGETTDLFTDYILNKILRKSKETNLQKEIKLAEEFDIEHLHFWMHEDEC